MQSNRWKLIVFTILVNIIVDQITKVWAIHSLKEAPTYRFLGDTFRLQYAENPGAFLSLGAGLSPTMRFIVLTIIVAFFLFAATVYLFRSPNMGASRAIGLSLLIGGGISNLIDRAFRDGGRVIDFLNIGVGDLRTGIFNIADIAIMAGIALVFFSKDPEPAKASGEAPVK